MIVCDCCHQERLDASERVGLFVENGKRKYSFLRFHGNLCDACVDKASSHTSREHRWLLKRYNEVKREGAEHA